ncbi:leucine-rich repeat neuronal protein 2-like [Limulus polyphemus]|uniref:Leucine-rich repeat neuronal protein 2-like n=1 Tax=Limulus polyphemus TaxID=6850 RepID=A0ABM1S3F8_LIMPO|nr:leucine-rich repeat neuronal protein 2-like [Limulus polyphemus]XP_013794824.1 leucine-rich repeat neuronal protein 2-like [Limulus polyphemus]XP_022238163.1 leucine-rich repeat neuronal protein 2-like [Limulus polyphemus]
MMIAVYMFLLLCSLFMACIHCDPAQLCGNRCLCSSTHDQKIVHTAVCSKDFPSQLTHNISVLIMKNLGKTLNKDDVNSPSKLTKLDLKGKIKEIQDHAFDIENLKNLSVLDLSNNTIQKLTSKTFSGLNNLRELYLDNNNVKVIENGTLTFMGKLNILFLNRNYLTDIPYLPMNITKLQLQHNHIRTVNFHGQKLYNLKYLDLSGNAYDSIKKMEFLLGNHIEQLSLGDQILQIEPQVFQETKELKRLELEGKDSLFPETWEGIFQINSLETLTIKYIPLPPLNQHNFSSMSHLKSLRLIHINTDVQMKRNVFKQLVQLEELDLQGSPNIAQHIINTNVLLSSLSHLKTLILQSVGIKTFRSNQSELLKNLSFLDISNNKLQCDCRLKWLINKVITGQMKLKNPKQTICSEPASYYGYSILDSRVTYTLCPKDESTDTEATKIPDKARVTFYPPSTSPNQSMNSKTIIYILIALSTMVVILAVLLIIMIFRNWRQK